MPEEVPDTVAGLYEKVGDYRDIALRWHMNEVLSALYESHVSDHGQLAGCELCQAWTTGRHVLARVLDRDQAEGRWRGDSGRA